ncbi:hypothetical protein ABIB37_002615 [Agrococcus sp. UYP10]|uniref:hypothetical protein n=1 Tax=Agrococcus sp. UYP10 TaxID=1756355 RepID=UPI00339787A5
MTTTEVLSLTTLIIAGLVAVGGYVRFVLVRANVGAQFDIEFTPLGIVNGRPAGDLALVITNLGSNLLVVTRVSCRVKYSTPVDAGAGAHDDEPTMSASPGGRSAEGSAALIHVFGGPDRSAPHARRPTSVISQGGTQAYRKPLTFPDGTGAVAIWASCDYHVGIGALERLIVRVVLRPRADLDYTRGLDNHLVRRTFRLDTGA